MNDKEMIEFWKRNERPFGLCPKECQEWLDNYYGDALIYTEKGEWSTEIFDSRGRLDDNLVIRIPTDYEPEKRGRWVEYPIVKMDDRDIGMVWAFLCEHANDSIKLSDAPGMVGFGGVKYADGWHAHPHWEGRKDSEPVKPVAVRFWVED